MGGRLTSHDHIHHRLSKNHTHHQVPRGFGIEDAAAERAGWLSRRGNPMLAASTNRLGGKFPPPYFHVFI